MKKFITIFNRGISMPVAIGTIVALLIAVKIGVLAYQHYFPNPESQSLTTATPEAESKKNKVVDWKTYENKEYGFQFEYPADLMKTSEEPMEESTCEIASDSDSPCKIFSVSGLFIAVINHKFDEKIVWDKEAIKKKHSDGKGSRTITIGGKEGYQYDFVTAVNYKIYGIQVPLDTDHFLLIEENAKMPIMKDGDWGRIISTFKFLNVN